MDNLEQNTVQKETKTPWFLDEAAFKSQMKTYKDSFLYNQSGNKGENLMKKHDQLLINFIMKSERIDKKSDKFTGVLEDVKRNQTSSILYTILLMDNVHLCVNSVELPPVFKVFDAYDIKSNDRKPAVFIDCTKLIIDHNGYYTCKNIGKLVSYLMAAMVYLSYRKDTNKILSNSAIVLTGTECYVTMFTYVLDYLRIIGYSANKANISYFVALFYLVNMMGKELDTYTKGIAAKVAKVQNSSIAALDLYVEEGMFENIDVFVSTIAEAFKLKGLTTEVFIQKWIYLFGNGTQYATELFTSFAVVLSYAFCGAYIINQKQIDSKCGPSMIKFCNTYMMIATELFDKRMYMSEAQLAKYEVHDAATQTLAESIRLSKKNINPEQLKFVKEDFESKESIEKKIEDNIDHYVRMFDGQEKLETIFETIVKMAMVSMDSVNNNSNEYKYGEGVMESVVSNAKRYISDGFKAGTKNSISRKIDAYTETMNNCRDTDIDQAKKYARSIKELRKCMNIL